MTDSLLHNLTTTATGDLSLLAWAGWRLNVPSEWRPLKLSGTPDKGWMMVGNSEYACFSIHWQQLGKALADGEAWARDRLKRLGLLPDIAPPAARHFDACAWAHEVQTEEHKRTTHWYGCAHGAKLLLGVKINGVLRKTGSELVTDLVLPSLRTLPADAATPWAMYDLSFVTPPGFTLIHRHLFVGDVALKFGRGRGESLMLRQVYPGDLALARRSSERWLAAYPFVEHRRLNSSSAKTSPWTDTTGRGLIGVAREGCKRLGFPLGRLMPRWNRAIAAYDPTLNRLLIAEHSAGSPPDPAVSDAAINRMNEHAREVGFDA